MNFTPLWTAALNAFSNFIIVDEHCRIAYMNKPYTEILNVQLEDVIGKPIKSVIPTTKLPEVMASGKAHIGALMTLYDHKTGKDISFVCNRIPLIEDGEVIGGVAISTFNEVGEIYNLSFFRCFCCRNNTCKKNCHHTCHQPFCNSSYIFHHLITFLLSIIFLSAFCPINVQNMYHHMSIVTLHKKHIVILCKIK